MPVKRLGYDNVITPQLLQGIANAEQGFVLPGGGFAKMKPEAVSPNVDSSGKTDSLDIGLFQLNHKRRVKDDLVTPKHDSFTEAYEFKYGEKPDSLLGLARDPYIATSVAHSASILKRRQLISAFKNRGLGDFDSIPHEQQAALIALAYQQGAVGLVENHLKKDKNFSISNPVKSIKDPKRS